MLNGWMGPRWVRSGWFHAYRLLGGSIADPAQKQAIDAAVERLQTADYAGPLERINLERDLVQLLASGCRAVVAGYTVKREYLNVEFSAGVENIGFDALEGLASPMFLRTVKLKDFPWNGWLQLGLEARPASAWNPIGGFTDPFGRLMWFAIADPALVPSPYEVDLDAQPHLRRRGLATQMTMPPHQRHPRAGGDPRKSPLPNAPARAARISPPPCGEGMGVGVASGGTANVCVPCARHAQFP